LHINCIGTNEILSSLIDFQQINQLLISNYRVLTYKFDTHLMNILCLKLYQLHITGDVAFAARQYISATRDIKWLKKEKGNTLIQNIAKFLGINNFIQ
jgi:hypothetical protein